MNFGLADIDLADIRHVLSRYPNVKKVLVFGSRAMGNFKPGSDVDLALVGDLDFETVRRIHGDLNERTLMPYFFDVLDYNALQNPALKKHIDEFGLPIYP